MRNHLTEKFKEINSEELLDLIYQSVRQPPFWVYSQEDQIRMHVLPRGDEVLVGRWHDSPSIACGWIFLPITAIKCSDVSDSGYGGSCPNDSDLFYAKS